MSKLSEKDRQDTIERYTSRYKEYGYSPKALGWDKGKQDIRFDILTANHQFEEKKILDVGCGFGDLASFLESKNGKPFSYTGIDVVPALIDEAKQRHSHSAKRFVVGDFLEIPFSEKFDYVIGSGIFNHRLESGNENEVIESFIDRACSLATGCIAFDFLSDKVDFRHDHTFHSSPEHVLKLAYKYSRNVVLRNDYMPFEFSIFIYKDDSFSTQDTIFSRYKESKYHQC